MSESLIWEALWKAWMKAVLSDEHSKLVFSLLFNRKLCWNALHCTSEIELLTNEEELVLHRLYLPYFQPAGFCMPKSHVNTEDHKICEFSDHPQHNFFWRNLRICSLWSKRCCLWKGFLKIITPSVHTHVLGSEMEGLWLRLHASSIVDYYYPI